MTFPSKPFAPRSGSGNDAWSRAARKNPLYFGLPFVATMVVASFALSSFTQTRYDLHDQKVTQISKQEELNLKSNRRAVDVREEYFRLESKNANDDWEPVRVPRPANTPDYPPPISR